MSVAPVDDADRRASAGLVGIGLAHDLRNLLSVAETSAFLATRSLDKDPKRTAMHLGRITEVVREAQGLLSATLAMSRGEDVPVEACSAGELVASAIRIVGGERTITAEPVAEELRIAVARPLAAAALVNVLKNACESGASVVRVEVRAAGAPPAEGDAGGGARIEVEVRDDGPGFPAGFEITTGVTTKAGGHGLGLATARTALGAMGAELAFARGDGGGAVVTLSFRRG